MRCARTFYTPYSVTDLQLSGSLSVLLNVLHAVVDGQEQIPLLLCSRNTVSVADPVFVGADAHIRPLSQICNYGAIASQTYPFPARQKKQVCEAFKNIPISGQSPPHMVKYLRKVGGP